MKLPVLSWAWQIYRSELVVRKEERVFYNHYYHLLTSFVFRRTLVSTDRNREKGRGFVCGFGVYDSLLNV